MPEDPTRTVRPRRRNRWCAAILAVLLALAVLHAAAPHVAAERHCNACQVLQTSALICPARSLPLPVPRCSLPIAERTDRPFTAPVRRLKQLRAPPVPSVL